MVLKLKYVLIVLIDDDSSELSFAILARYRYDLIRLSVSFGYYKNSNWKKKEEIKRNPKNCSVEGKRL